MISMKLLILSICWWIPHGFLSSPRIDHPTDKPTNDPCYLTNSKTKHFFPKLFQRCLMSVLNIDLWKCYITYVKQTKATLQTYRCVCEGQRLSPWLHTFSFFWLLQREAATDLWVCLRSRWYWLPFRVSVAGFHSIRQRGVSDRII